MNSLIPIKPSLKHIKDYKNLTPQVVDEILQIADNLKGLRVVHLNATSLGGGVAEMLQSIIPIQRDIGLKSSWYVIPPNEEFFKITKQVHNFLQGKAGELTQKEKDIYIKYNRYIAKLVDQIETDILIVHDPQSAASISYLKNKPRICIWRCHIDMTAPNKSVWNFLSPHIKRYDHFVFSMPDFVPKEINQGTFSIICPVIDPLSVKNRLMSKKEAQTYIQKFGINVNKPLVTQVSRLDPWKDPKGVIDAYRSAKKEVPNIQLVLLTQMALDDPEGLLIYKQVRDYIGREEDITLLANLDDNDLAVNAFQTASTVMVQKSIREGFGLTITEAMWKGAVVVAGNVGGIRFQIQDGVNGFLVNSSDEAAEKIIFVLSHPEITEKISEVAHKTVEDKFLLTHDILRWLKLFKTLIS